MISHAWTVICERTSVDSVTNNISLDVVEQLNGSSPVEPPQGNLLLPYPLRVASLWYRSDGDPEHAEAVVQMHDPNAQLLGEFRVPIDAESRRVRTVVTLGAVPYTSPGIYFFVVRLLDAEVARVPLEIRVEAASD
jgi:hypothetical protein